MVGPLTRQHHVLLASVIAYHQFLGGSLVLLTRCLLVLGHPWLEIEVLLNNLGVVAAHPLRSPALLVLLPQDLTRVARHVTGRNRMIQLWLITVLLLLHLGLSLIKQVRMLRVGNTYLSIVRIVQTLLPQVVGSGAGLPLDRSVLLLRLLLLVVGLLLLAVVLLHLLNKLAFIFVLAVTWIHLLEI